MRDILEYENLNLNFDKREAFKLAIPRPNREESACCVLIINESRLRNAGDATQ
jgi:hypothetical protein